MLDKIAVYTRLILNYNKGINFSFNGKSPRLGEESQERYSQLTLGKGSTGAS